VDARRHAAAGKSISINGIQVHHDDMRAAHVEFDSYMIFYSRTQPWSSLGLLRRVARVCRVVFGTVLFSGIVLIIIGLISGLSSSHSVAHAVEAIAISIFLAPLAWSVGCMFIWRGVSRPSLPSSGGSPPPEPPTEGAPRPAPLRPYSPLIHSAAAELPNERNE
jgi:hypothetical protein